MVAPIGKVGEQIKMRAWQREGQMTASGMSTMPMPEEDLDFLRAYTSAQGISPEAFLARRARNLREHLEQPLHPDVAGATGIVSAHVAGGEAHRDSLERRHS